MSATSLVQNIPLNRLVLSPGNVRKTAASASEEAELKASLRARGLLQNLLVHPAPDNDNLFAVHAGGRRLKLLQELAAEGVIAPDHEVPCRIEAPDAACESSLMENTARAAMHPADEFTAMAALIETGATIDAVAQRFGVGERHVRQRLRLGKVAPEILDAYRAGEVTLEVVMAFTLGVNHEAQRTVWQQLKADRYLSAYRVRRLLTETAVEIHSDLGLFVGVEAYEAAGGTITRDLFSNEDDGFMEDAALVQRLAIEKLEAKAAELRADWAWAEAMLDPVYGFTAAYGRVQPQPADYPPEVSAELEAIERRQREIEELPEDSWTDELAADSARLGERYDELIETTEAAESYAPDDRAISGCIVTMGDDGEFRIYQGLVDRTAHPQTGADTAEYNNDDDGFGNTSDDEEELEQSEPSREAAIRKEGGFSQSLIDDLKAHRQLITQAHLAGDFAVAFDLALYAMCVDVLESRCRSHPLSLRTHQICPRSSLNDLADTAANRLLQAREKELDTAWLSLPPAVGFAALSALPPEAKQRLFAWCVAASVEAQLGIEDKADPVLEVAGDRLAIPFAEFWRPTAANYWGRVKKAHALELAATVLGPRWAKDHADDKKAVLAAALEKALDPAISARSIGLDQAARDAAAVWLPPGIAFTGVAAAVSHENDNPLDEAEVEFDDGATSTDANDADDDDSVVANATELDPGEDLPEFLTEDEVAP